MPRDRFHAFDPDLKGIGQMMTRADMRSAMEYYIGIVHGVAVSRSPVSTDNRPGHKHYIECFETDGYTQRMPPRRGHLNERAAARLSNTSDHAEFVEFGANGVRKNRVMRNALDALGPPTGKNGQGPVVERWGF